ncbi:MobF family relaxase [Polymorphobacter megasporae]|uniref:MobF family relaxase n=1 Tax=Glacieibacterium megasporae TaxID=2835787 RepID=UPI001C1E0517|nr:MobF family relaxase [Polymorphobacter megasporae]UAJ12402.1 conjugative relaxase [Polymorphobacter megasporae]
MISAASVGGAGAAGSYYTRDNSYSAEDLEQSSQWLGAGAQTAGLVGSVSIDTFTEVLKGRLPDGRVIGNGQTGSHRAGMDLTFSAPKSLSMLAYVGGDTRLLDANMAAVKATLAWAEKHLAEARTGAGGANVVKTGNLIVALFQHDTSRNLDPQAHVHAVIANATQTADGKWHALHNDKLWSNNTLLGSIYHAYLREGVTKLGYAIGSIGKHGSFEIAGVDRNAVEAFSTRRAEILAAAAEVLDYQSPAGLEQVALRTRAEKADIADRGELLQTWQDRAAANGIDLTPVVEAARTAAAAAAEQPSAWTKLVAGTRLISERTARIVDYIREHLGIEPNDNAVLLPARAEYGTPIEVAAAHGVASAIRHLHEREAAFSTAGVIKAALDLGLPITIGDVERNLKSLAREGKLVAGTGDQKHMLTTPAAIGFERALLDAIARDHGTVVPIVADRDDAGQRLQSAAATRGQFTLNAGQEGTGRLILASRDRIVAVQGIAGAGKSAALGAVADVARAQGRNVLALVPTHKLVDDLGRGSGIDTMTTAKFVASHQWLLKDTVNPERLTFAREAFHGSVIVVDEASMLGTGQTTKLVALANLLGVDRLALVGDKRQLGAIEAGKPFAQAQDRVQTAELTENLRGRHSLVRAAAEHVNNDRPVAALDVLKPWTRDAAAEAPTLRDRDSRRDWLVATATAEYLALTPDERASTLLISSSRALGDALNKGVQRALVEEGRVGAGLLKLQVFDTLSLTREQERYASSYAIGAIVEIGREIKDQKIAPGSATVTAIKNNIVELTRANGTVDRLDPKRLSDRRTANSFRIGTIKEIELRENDKVRWTANDRDRGLLNAGIADVVSIGENGVVVRNASGIEVTLPTRDRMLKNLDLGYALNTHKVQGATADRAIAVMDSSERSLASAKLFLVNTTRPRDAITLVIDSHDRIAAGLEGNSGDKTSALEIIGALRSLSPPVRPGEREAIAAGIAARNAKSEAPEPSRAPPERFIERVPARAPEIQPDHGL